MFTYTLRSKEEIQAVKNMFNNKDFTDENFIKYFTNAKSRQTSLLYKDFVLALIKFKEDDSEINLNELMRLSRDNKIKKAFSSGRLAFIFKRNDTTDMLLETNKESIFLSDDDFDIYLEFIFSKHLYLIRSIQIWIEEYFRLQEQLALKTV